MTADIAKLKALAERFWRVTPGELQDVGISREEFYFSEMSTIFDSLTSRVQELEKERDAHKANYADLFQGAYMRAVNLAAENEARAEAAEKMVAKLNEALQPFVIPRDGAHSGAPSESYPVFAVDGQEVTVGDFRRARKALGDQP